MEPMSAAKTRGFTIVEVGISMLVLSIGIFGIVQTHSGLINDSKNTYNRAKANLAAMSIMDAIRSNPANMKEDTNSPPGYVRYDVYDSETYTIPPTPPNCIDSNSTDVTTVWCNKTDLVAHDIYLWSANFLDIYSEGSHFKPLLPNGKAKIDPGTIPNAGGYTITITWTEKGWDDTGGAADGMRANNEETLVKHLPPPPYTSSEL